MRHGRTCLLRRLGRRRSFKGRPAPSRRCVASAAGCRSTHSIGSLRRRAAELLLVLHRARQRSGRRRRRRPFPVPSGSKSRRLRILLRILLQRAWLLPPRTPSSPPMKAVAMRRGMRAGWASGLSTSVETATGGLRTWSPSTNRIASKSRRCVLAAGYPSRLSFPAILLSPRPLLPRGPARQIETSVRVHLSGGRVQPGRGRAGPGRAQRGPAAEEQLPGRGLLVIAAAAMACRHHGLCTLAEEGLAHSGTGSQLLFAIRLCGAASAGS